MSDIVSRAARPRELPRPDADMVELTIDGRELSVPKGTLVIRAAEELGTVIPRFCDHPLLAPVAACRQCLVEVEGQRKPMTACSTQCTPGMVVKTHQTSELARLGQQGQLELLLINHPLDCPQCDKGGECPLQDQALAHGPGDSRFIDNKRRYEKPLPISAQVALDRERCVLCARCTRFSSEISGDPFIELFERGALEQVAIYSDEPYESYFSGNVVQICPVGALTAASYRFHARPFDLRSIPGVCNQCSAGCNLRVDVRRGEVQRQLAAENMAVNEMWNCDKGRFGFEWVAHPDRLREPVARNDFGNLERTSWLGALRRAGQGLRAAIDTGGPSAVGVLTGGRLTDEDSYALSRFTRDVLRTDNVDFRLSPRTDDEVEVLASVAGRMGPSYDDVERADVVIVAGLDPEEEVPILHLRLRKAWRKLRQKIVVVGPVLGSLEEIAWAWVPTAVGDEGRALDALNGAGTEGAQAALEGLEQVVEALGAEDVSVVVLAGERLARSPGALPAAAALARDREYGFAWVPRRNNARGALDAGLLPGLLPGGRTLAEAGPVAQAWHGLPEQVGLDARGMLEAAAAGEVKALLLVGVDPVRDFEDPDLARAALERVDTLVVQDCLPTESQRHADVILPAAAPHERVGSFTTWEGRRQPFPQALPPQGLAETDWDILRQLALVMGADLGWETANDVRREAAPLMQGAGEPFRREVAVRDGGGAEGEGTPEFEAVTLDYLIGDGTMLAGARALKATARPATVWLHPDDAGRVGAVDGRHVAVHAGQARLELPVRVTPSVASGCVVVPGPSTGHGVAGWSTAGRTAVRVEVTGDRGDARHGPDSRADEPPRPDRPADESAADSREPRNA